MTSFYDQLYARKVKIWPSEEVVAFVESNRAMLIGGKVLDIGCGAGRHAIYMARRGIEAYGLDLSPVAIDHARRWAAAENLNVRFLLGDFHRLPYASGMFAAVVAWESLFFGETTSVRAAIGEVFRVLKRDGSFFLMLKSKEDFRFREYPKLDRHCTQSEQGIPVTCFTREEIEHEFSARTAELNVELSNHSLKNGKQMVANFIVSGRNQTARTQT
jgi:ubiquinone/menaquinone biosynthesis C-methylase UbiE